jgi:hypothetical protein
MGKPSVTKNDISDFVCSLFFFEILKNVVLVARIPFLHRNQFKITFVSFRVRIKQKEF